MFHKKQPEPKEIAREARREVRGAERDLDREVRTLERQEKTLIADIKKTAKTGNQSATRTLAGQLVTLRAQKEKLYSAKARITGIGYAASATATQAAMAGIMGNVAGVMKQVNDRMDPAETAAIMQQFAKQNEAMSMREELIDDALIDAFDGEGVEAETDAVVDQVLHEIGLDLGGMVPDAPKGAIAGRQAQGEEAKAEEQRTQELLKQLNAL